MVKPLARARVVITGLPEFQQSIESLDLEVSEILLKPIVPYELIRISLELTGSI